MVYLANLSGTTYLTESTPIYQGSSIVNTITIVCPLPKTSNATVTFKLPNGMPTQPKLMTRQGESFIGENIIGVLNAWSVELDQYVTNYAGTVEVQFDFYRGYGNENNSAILSSFKTAFEVQPGIVPSLPSTPTQTIYEEILSALTNVENQQFGKFELFGENVYNVVEWVDAIDGFTGDTYLVNRINPEHYVNIGNAIFTNGSFNSSTPITLTPNTTNWTFEIDGYTESGYNLLTIGELITVIANGSNYAIVVGENTYGAVAESNANLFAFAKTENTLSVYYNGVLLDEIDINIGNPLITIGNNISYDFSTYKLFDIAIDEDFAYEEWRGQIYRDDKLDDKEKYKMDLLFNYGQDITTLYKDTVHTISAEWKPPSNGINTHELDLKLKNAEGDVISTVTIDFPLESLVVDATYDSENRAIVLILDNKDEITIPIGDIFKGLITEENIGEQSVKYAASAGSATKDANGNVINTYYAPKSSVDVLIGTVNGFEASIEEAVSNSADAISKAEAVESSVNSALNGKANQGEVDTLSQEQAVISPLARDSAQGITLSASGYKYTFTLKNYLGNNAGEHTSAVAPSVELDLGDMIQSGEFGATSTYPGGVIALKSKNPLLSDIIIPLTNNITSQNIGEQRVAYATNSMYYVDVDDANNPKYIAGTFSALNTAVQEATSTVGTFQSQINGKADAEAVENRFLAIEQANTQLSGEIDALETTVSQQGANITSQGTAISNLQTSVNTLNGNSLTTGSVQYYVAREETRATSIENALRTDVNTAFDDISVDYNSTTHEITITMDRVSGQSKSQSFNLPLESAIVGASYSNETKDITFTLQSGDTLTVQLDDIISGLATTSDLNDVDSRLTAAIGEVSTELNQKASITYVDSGLSAKADKSSLSSVATTGDYNDLSNKPSINNATLTIQKNGVIVSTFSANAAENSVANILVPTSTSGLTNDSGFVNSVYVNNAITDALDDYTAPVDSALSTTSINPVQNKVITEALNNKISSSGQLSENKVLVTNSFGQVISSSVSSSALNNIQGLTSGAQAQIDLIKGDITTINTNISNNISPAIQEITGNVTTLTSRVDTATQNIDALTETKADVSALVNGLNTKANQTDLNETNQTVSDLVTSVENIQAAITTKANIGSKSSVSSNNYIIDVPTTSAPYALISKIGGMSYKSNNLFNPFTIERIVTHNGLTYTINDDGTISAKGRSTSGNAYLTFGGITVSQDCFLSGAPSGAGASTYELRLLKGGQYYNDYGNGVSIPAGTYSDVQIVVRAGVTVDIVFKPMLNVGSTALPYETYFEGIRNAKVTEVKSVGRNIHNPNTDTLGYYKDPTYGAISNSSGFYTDYTRVKPSTTYTYSFAISYTYFYDANKQLISATFDKSQVTTPSNCYYMVWSGFVANPKTWQVCEGNTVPTDLTYIEHTLTIPKEVQNYVGYGQSNPDNANEYNYLDLINQKFVTVGHIVNGVWEAYNSTENISISDSISVEGGGTLTFENEYGYNVPSEVEFFNNSNETILAKEFVGNLVGVADRAKTADVVSNATNAVYASPSTDENSIHIQLQSAQGKADTAISTAQSAIQYAARGVQSISTTYNSGVGSVGTFYLNVNFSGGGSASYDITEDLRELITDVFMFDIN